MTNRLIILGASARAAAFSAIRAGFEPYAIDCYADRDLAAACPAVKIDRYPFDFLPALADAPSAPWLYTGGLENYPRLIEWMAGVRPLWGNRGAGLRGVRNSRRLAEACRDAGFSFPQTVLTSEQADRNSRWLIKRRRSSGGLGVRFAEQEDWIRPQRKSFFQQFIEGQAASATFVAASGRAALLGACRQLLGRDVGLENQPFLYAGSIAPLILLEDERARLRRLGNVLAERFGLMGLFGVDLVCTDNELWPIEVNPRYPASVEVLERTTGCDFLALHAIACESGTISAEAPPFPANFAGKQVIYARQDGIVPARIDRLVSDWNRAGQPVEIADLPRVGEPILGGQPVVTVLAGGDSDSIVQARLRARAVAVEEVLSTEY